MPNNSPAVPATNTAAHARRKRRQGPHRAGEGARVSLVFDAGNTFVLGDVIELDFVLSNAGTSAFTYGTGGDYRGTGFPTRYRWSAVDESETPLMLEPSQDLGGLGGPRTLAPGAEYRERLRVQHYVRVTRPGTFTLRVTHDFGWRATDERPLPVATATSQRCRNLRQVA